MGMQFAQDREIRGPTCPPNLLFLDGPGANRQWGSYQLLPLAGRVMEKGLAGRGLSGGEEFLGFLGI